MNEADFTEIETRLGITLPADYRRITAAEGPELVSLALDYQPEVDYLSRVFLLADHVIESNLAERQPDSGCGYAFPNWWQTYVLVGTNGAGDYYCLRLDEEPDVWKIGSDCGDEAIATHDTFQNLVDELRDWYHEEMASPELVVSMPYLASDDWQELKQALGESSDLGNDYAEFSRQQDQRLVQHLRAGKNPFRILIPPTEFLAWCSTNNRSPDAASREAFAGERLLVKNPWVGKHRR